MKHLIFTFLLLAPSILFAQDEYGKITGKVLDSKGLPISADTVLLLSGATIINGAITDDQGIFSIQPIEPGTYNVQIEYLYFKKEITGVTVLSGGTRDLGAIQFQNLDSEGALKGAEIIKFKAPLFESSSRCGANFDAKGGKKLKNI
jgi:hypothetical protein